MENKIPSANDLFKIYSNLYQFEEGSPEYLIDKEDFREVMIEFAKLHVKQALETAAEEVKVFVNVSILLDKPENKDKIKVYKESILNAYPEDNIT